MYYALQIIKDRRFWLLVFALAGLFLLLYLFTHSVLIIDSKTNEERTIFIRKEGFERKVTLNNSSRRYVLPSGEYDIEVVGQNSQSFYRKKLRPFWVHKVDVETTKIKKSEFLGKSYLTCGRLGDSGTPLFYSCQPSNLASIQSSAPLSSSDSGDEEYYSEGEDSTTALQVYGNGFLQATANGSYLQLDKRTANSSDSIIDLEGFEDTISDSKFSVFNQSVAAFDTQTSRLYFNKITNVSKYQNTEVNMDLFAAEDSSNAQIYSTPNYVYITSAIGEEEAAGGESSDSAIPNDRHTETRIIIFSREEGKVVKDLSLDRDWEINNFFSGPHDTLILTLGSEQEYNTYTVSPKGKVLPLYGSKDTLQQACTLNNDNVYYLADGGHNIYEYDIDNQSSKLVYDNQFNSVLGLSCANNKPYFTISNDNEEDLDILFHYTISDKEQHGQRLDSVLPLYYTINQDTLKFNESRAGAMVDMLYDSDQNGGGPKEPVRNKLLELLQEKGVDTNGLVIEFAY